MAAKGTGIAELAARYAAALYELASEQQAIEEVSQDLGKIAQVLNDNPELQCLVRSPVIPARDQARAFAAILEQLGVSDLIRRFVGVVAENGRLSALGRVIEAFESEVAARRGLVRARVAVARPMTDTQTEALISALRESVSDKVEVEVRVDPALLGGMVVRVGSRMVDGSLRSKIDRMQLALKVPGGTL